MLLSVPPHSTRGVGVYAADSTAGRSPSRHFLGSINCSVITFIKQGKGLGVLACFASRHGYKADQELAISLLIFTYV